MKSLIILLICIGNILNINAQNWKQDFTLVNKTLNSAQNFQTVITTKMYGSDNKVKTQKSVIVKKKNKDFLYELDDLTILINSKHIITVDKNDKSITYNENNSQAGQLNSVSDQLDDVLDDIESIKFRSGENGIKIYTMDVDDDLYDKVEIHINMEKAMYSKIIYYYKSSEEHNLVKAVIEFQKTDVQTVLPEDTFLESKYVSISQGHIRPGVAYRQYSINAE